MGLLTVNTITDKPAFSDPIYFLGSGGGNFLDFFLEIFFGLYEKNYI